MLGHQDGEAHLRISGSAAPIALGCTEHTAQHQAESRSSRLRRRQRQRLGQTAGFIQLNVDHIVAPRQGFQTTASMAAALICTNGQRMNKILPWRRHPARAAAVAQHRDIPQMIPPVTGNAPPAPPDATIHWRPQ